MTIQSKPVRPVPLPLAAGPRRRPAGRGAQTTLEGRLPAAATRRCAIADVAAHRATVTRRRTIVRPRPRHRAATRLRRRGAGDGRRRGDLGGRRHLVGAGAGDAGRLRRHLRRDRHHRAPAQRRWRSTRVEPCERATPQVGPGCGRWCRAPAPSGRTRRPPASPPPPRWPPSARALWRPCAAPPACGRGCSTGTE